MRKFLRKLYSFIFCADDMQAEGTQREFTAKPDVINLCKADLKQIDVGMYIFTDNTLSHHLQSNKAIRAIVLGKQGKTVYALLPDEQNLIYERDRDYREFVPQILVDDAYMCCIKRMPILNTLMNAYFYVKDLNQALEEAKLPKLVGRYWSWDHSRPYFMYDVEKGEKYLITKSCCAKARFILEIKLK